MARIEIKDIKVGDTFYEHYYNQTAEFVALEDAWRQDSGWTVIAEKPSDSTDKIYTFYVRDGFEHYGPNLYSEPAYGL